MFLALLVSALPAVLPLAPFQEDGGETRKDPVLVSLADLTVQRYNAEHAEPLELLRLTQQMVGRQLYVVERGGYQSEAVMNVQLIGDTLVLYDTKEYLVRMAQMLTELDQPRGEAPVDGVRQQEFQTWEYTPRYLSLEAVFEVVQPLQRYVNVNDPRVTRASPGGVGVSQTSNISLSEERRLVVVRDVVERVKEIRTLLERVDVPQDQVAITCWLLQGGAAPGEEDGLPSALREHLARLVPGQEFRQIGFGMLQSSVSTQHSVSLQLAAPNGQGQVPYYFELRPTAFDRQSGSLSVSGCSLSHAQGGSNPLFSTSAVLRGGEYTVIGASGSEPILVTILVTPVGS